MNDVRALGGEKFDFCLLVPCFNNREGLVMSLKSVTYISNTFLIVIVDDGSMIPVSAKEISDYTTGSVKVIRLVRNEGITRALNKGLDWIVANVNTQYVARLDCGDICHKDRFIKQVRFLDNNPAITLLGSWCTFEDEVKGQKFIYRSPEQHKAIFRDMYFRNSFMHASIMMRLTAVKEAGFYPVDYEYAEDYALCWILCKNAKVYIMQESLVNCMLNRKGISFKNKNKQLMARLRVVRNLAPNSLYKLFGILKIYCLRLMPRELILRLKIFVDKMQRA